MGIVESTTGGLTVNVALQELSSESALQEQSSRQPIPPGDSGDTCPGEQSYDAEKISQHGERMFTL